MTGTPVASPTGGGATITPIATASVNTVTTGHHPGPQSSPTSLRPGSPPAVRCPSLCAHMPCGDGQSVNRWSVDDVVAYVSSIDICAEYAQVSPFIVTTFYSLQFNLTCLLETLDDQNSRIRLKTGSIEL